MRLSAEGSATRRQNPEGIRKRRRGEGWGVGVGGGGGGQGGPA
jgi:hypothetical protein